MPRAFNLIRAEPHYRRNAFATGLQAAGYDVRSAHPSSIDRGDVVLMWNRYGDNDVLACRAESAGGTVLVAENGYVGPGGVSPHAMDPREIYALAIGGHNGSGRWAIGGAERWAALGVELKPWRDVGEHILVCPNRSFGRPDVMMPPDWAAHVCKRLRKLTQREVRLRPHPGNGQPKVPLAADLKNAYAVVIWSSSAGVHALLEGIPVICEAPTWICYGAALWSIAEHAADPLLVSSRLNVLRGLAWAQWHVDEIATGEPFRRLLETDRSAVAA